MKTTTFLILTLIYLGCNNSPKSAELEEKQTSNIKITNDKLEIRIITDWPDEIDGCSCYYSRNENEFTDRQYIYMDNYDNLAFMNINGQLERFKLTDSDTITSSNNSRKYGIIAIMN